MFQPRCDEHLLVHLLRETPALVPELARYPISIYGGVVRLILPLVLPYAFMTCFPATAVLSPGSTPWPGPLTPVAATWCLLLGRWAFRRGLLRYGSAGN